MPTRIFKLDEDAKCPACGKSLDEVPARDFVWMVDGVPSSKPCEDRCGWCDAFFIARGTADGQVEIRTRD